ncbi:MAG TPA: tRNA-specific adenosine deaminase, partial [Treponema sp.]|nr:tRNA-specific adenosine deaminase [Treponema sp.]
MPIIIRSEPDAKDLELLYEAGRVARRARQKGNHPFGCLLADE